MSDELKPGPVETPQQSLRRLFTAFHKTRLTPDIRLSADDMAILLRLAEAYEDNRPSPAPADAGLVARPKCYRCNSTGWSGVRGETVGGETTWFDPVPCAYCHPKEAADKLSCLTAELRKERDEAKEYRENRRPSPAPADAETALGNLLAIIHRDGGHNLAKVGMYESVNAAHVIWADAGLEKIRIYGGDYTTGEGHQECRQIAIAARAAIRTLPAEKPGEPEGAGK